jgi:hypothetical protein
LKWVCDEIEEVRLRTMWVALFIDAAQNRIVDPSLKCFAAPLRKGTWRFRQLVGDSE